MRLADALHARQFRLARAAKVDWLTVPGGVLIALLPGFAARPTLAGAT
jgi:hypothetical protein